MRHEGTDVQDERDRVITIQGVYQVICMGCRIKRVYGYMSTLQEFSKGMLFT